MKITFLYDHYIIEVFEDSSFSQGPDSATHYDKIYEPEVDKDFKPSSQHAIAVFDGEQQVSSVILLAAAGATSVTNNAALLDNNNLIIRCSNVVFSLAIPGLNLNWMAQADPITCFSIHQYQESYISHGEISVSRIDRKGNILWEYGGNDIFLRLDADDCFIMTDNSIILKDFTGTIYEIDYMGKTLSTTNPKLINKSWWKFW